MTTNKKRTLWTPALAIALGVSAACGGVSLQTLTSSESPDGSGSTEPSRTSSESSARTAVPPEFNEISEEENKKRARSFKATLRQGSIAKLFPDGEVFARVESICGTKIWDQCLVTYESEGDDLRWQPWSFKRTDSDEIHTYPYMFFEMTEPRWAEATIERLNKSEAPELFIGMVQDKCGDPLDSRCEVRGYQDSDNFRPTVRDTGEVIEVMQTLRDWQEDL